MANESRPVEGQETPPEQPDSALTTYLNALIHPSAAFQSLAGKPRWLLPLLFSILAIGTIQMIAIERIGARNIARQQTAFVENMGFDIPQERLDLMTERAEAQLKFAPILAAIFLPIGMLVISGLLYLGVMAMGGEVRVYSVIGAVFHSLGAYYVILAALSLLVVMLSPTPEELNLQNLVMANPAFLVTQQESPAIYSLLSSIDLTSFYAIYLLGLGLSIVSQGVSRGMGIGIVMVYWLLWVIGKVGLAAIFS